MPSAIPPRDVSATWRRHRCGARHSMAAPCPRLGYWLISGQPVNGGRAATVTPIVHGRKPHHAR